MWWFMSVLGALLVGIAIGVVLSITPSLPVLVVQHLWKNLLGRVFLPERTSVHVERDSTNLLLNLNLQHISTWENLGYWPTVSTVNSTSTISYTEACESLALKLVEFTGLSSTIINSTPYDVLDVGCGYGDQDISWIRKFPSINHIDAVNINFTQLECARKLAKEQHIQASITYHLDDAGNIRKRFYGYKSFHYVFALDCAYHFPSRVEFCRDSFQLLHPNGCIGLCDLFLSIPERQKSSAPLTFWDKLKYSNFTRRLSMSILSRLCQVPMNNLTGATEFTCELGKMGFMDIKLEDISLNMFDGFNRYIEQQHSALSSLMNPQAWMKLKITGALLGFAHRHQLARFLLISARKPN